MGAPRLEIDLDKIHHNASTLVERLAARGISVTGVTKATLGSADIARTMLRAGVKTLGDSRIENIEAMHGNGVSASMMLIRSPMPSQVSRIVKHAEVSLNTEIDVIRLLSSAAQKEKRMHGVVLMVELGDLREGIMPEDLASIAEQALCLPYIVIKGIGVNLACQSGVSPDADNMSELSRLANLIEAKYGLAMDIVSGGNSASLDWALSGADCGRINNLRLGESILLGREPLHRKAIDGLYTDAITLVAEVIESRIKPSQPWGTIAQTAFGEHALPLNRGNISQTIIAVGHQDIDPSGLGPPPGIEILGASSDHLIVESVHGDVPVGTELTFQLNYSALVRAMTSPFVATVVKPQDSLCMVN